MDLRLAKPAIICDRGRLLAQSALQQALPATVAPAIRSSRVAEGFFKPANVSCREMESHRE